MTETPDPNTGPVWGSPAEQAPEADPTPTPAPFEQVWTAAGPNVTPTQADNPRRVGRLAGVAIVAAFALVAVTAVGAFALSRQGGDTGSSAGAAVAANTSNNSAQALAGSNGTKNQALCQSLLDNLANQFKVSTTDLQSGFVAAANKTIDDAVAAGTLTADQGKAMKDRLSSMPANPCAVLPLMGRGMMGGEWGGEQPNPNATPNPNAAPNPNGPNTGAPRIRGLAPFGLFRSGAVLDAVAKSLNITSDQLRTELGQLKAGEGVCTVAAKHGDTNCATAKTAAHTALQTQLDASVKAGRITQAQEDQALSALDTWFASGAKLPQFRMGPGFGGGMGGGMFPGFGGSGPGGSGPGSDQNPPTQTQ